MFVGCLECGMIVEVAVFASDMLTIAVTVDVFVVISLRLASLQPIVFIYCTPPFICLSPLHRHDKTVGIAFTSQPLFFLCADTVPVRLEYNANDIGYPHY